MSGHGDSEISAEDLPISIIIPVYNEAEILEKNLDSLSCFFNDLVGPTNWHFILVENGSTDKTQTLVRLYQERHPYTQALFLAEPNYGAALKAGLRFATTKWACLLDIEQWDLFFLRWAWKNRASFDLFMGSKRLDPTLNQQQPYRRILSAGLNSLLQIFFHFTGSDTHGPKLLNRESLAAIIKKCESDRGQFDTELVLRAAHSQKRLVEVPIKYSESRPNRNWMIKKVIWNIFALRRLHRTMKLQPISGPLHYYRFTRAELENTTLVAKGLAGANVDV